MTKKQVEKKPWKEKICKTRKQEIDKTEIKFVAKWKKIIMIQNEIKKMKEWN